MIAHLALLLPSVLGTLLGLGIMGYALRRRPEPAWRELAGFAGAVSWWCAGQFLWLLPTGLDLRLRVSQFQYVGIVSAPVFWFLLAQSFTGNRLWSRWAMRAGLAVVPAITLILAFTNDLHGWIWRFIDVPVNGVHFTVIYGPWFWFHAVYAYSLVFFATIVLALRFASSPLYRFSFMLVISGPVLVFLVNLLHLSGRSPLPMDGTPLAFAICLAAVWWAVRRRGLFQLVPVARGLMVEGLEDGVLVLDGLGRIIDANPAAQYFLGLPGGRLLGTPLSDFLPESRDHPQEGRETRLSDGRRLELRSSRIPHPGGGGLGEVVLLRDVTREREAQEKLQEAREALRRMNQELEERANTDALTGLANRRRLLEELDKEWARCQRTGRPLSVLLMDLDYFKEVNDSRGHLAGDAVLEAVGDALRLELRPQDLPARYGGEEFAILLTETDLEEAAAVAERIRIAVGALVHTDEAGGAFQVSISGGVATSGNLDGSSRDLLMRADGALYHAKETGRDGVSRWHDGEMERV